MLEHILKSTLQSNLESELSDYDIKVSNDINYNLFESVNVKQLSAIIRTNSGVKSNIAGIATTQNNIFIELACVANELQEVLVALNEIAETLNGTIITDDGYSYFIKLDNPTIMGSPIGVKVSNGSVKAVMINWTGEALASNKSIFDTNVYDLSVNAGVNYYQIKYITSMVRDFEIVTENQPLENGVFNNQEPISMATSYSFTCLREFGDTLQDALIAIADGSTAFDTANLRFKIGSSVISVQNIKTTTITEIGKIPTITITLTR